MLVHLLKPPDLWHTKRDKGMAYLDEDFYANAYRVMLDVGKIMIGDNVQGGPSVSIYTAGHPIHPQSRKSGYEYGIPVTIGDRVWIGEGLRGPARSHDRVGYGDRGGQCGDKRYPGMGGRCGRFLQGHPKDHGGRQEILL